MSRLNLKSTVWRVLLTVNVLALAFCLVLAQANELAAAQVERPLDAADPAAIPAPPTPQLLPPVAAAQIGPLLAQRAQILGLAPWVDSPLVRWWEDAATAQIDACWLNAPFVGGHEGPMFADCRAAAAAHLLGLLNVLQQTVPVGPASTASPDVSVTGSIRPSAGQLTNEAFWERYAVVTRNLHELPQTEQIYVARAAGTQIPPDWHQILSTFGPALVLGGVVLLMVIVVIGTLIQGRRARGMFSV